MASSLIVACLLGGVDHVGSLGDITRSLCLQAFLVGLSNGSVALHSTERAMAVREWPGVCEGRVAALRWLPSRPACFVTLDAACQVLCFDLAQVRPRCCHDIMSTSSTGMTQSSHVTARRSTSSVNKASQRKSSQFYMFCKALWPNWS